MKKNASYIIDVAVRYSLLLLIGIFGVQIFHFIFLPLTLYPVFFLLDIFFQASIISNVIFVNYFPIEIISACVAGSAYILLLILNLSIPKIPVQKRILMLLFSFSSFLLLNVLRIFFLSLMLISGSSLFDLTHKIFWYAGSTIFVVGIWFLSIKIFRIKEIPFYSDIMNISSGKYAKKTKSSKKH